MPRVKIVAMYCEYNIALVILWYLAPGIDSSLIFPQQNVAVIENQSARLNCSSGVAAAILSWYNSECGFVQAPPCPAANTVYTGYSLGNFPASRFNVETATDSGAAVSRDLIINETYFSDFGIYVCAEFNAGSYYGLSAQLNVIGSAPSITYPMSVTDGQAFDITCSMPFAGNWNSSMLFEDVAKGNSYMVMQPTSQSSGSAIFLLSLTANASFNGSRFRCSLFFDISNKPANTNASNVPSIPPGVSSSEGSQNITVTAEKLTTSKPGSSANGTRNSTSPPQSQSTPAEDDKSATSNPGSSANGMGNSTYPQQSQSTPAGDDKSATSNPGSSANGTRNSTSPPQSQSTPASETGLSTGTLVGIVVGSVAGVTASAALAMLAVRNAFSLSKFDPPMDTPKIATNSSAADINKTEPTVVRGNFNEYIMQHNDYYNHLPNRPLSIDSYYRGIQNGPFSARAWYYSHKPTFVAPDPIVAKARHSIYYHNYLN